MWPIYTNTCKVFTCTDCGWDCSITYSHVLFENLSLKRIFVILVTFFVVPCGYFVRNYYEFDSFEDKTWFKMFVTTFYNSNLFSTVFRNSNEFLTVFRNSN